MPVTVICNLKLSVRHAGGASAACHGHVTVVRSWKETGEERGGLGDDPGAGMIGRIGPIRSDANLMSGPGHQAQ